MSSEEPTPLPFVLSLFNHRRVVTGQSAEIGGERYGRALCFVGDMTDVLPQPVPFAPPRSPEYVLAQDFARRLASFDWVKRVVFTDGPEREVRVDIDAPPFDHAYRKPIYEAEFATLDECPDGVELEFSLANVQEYGGKTIRSAIPGEIVLLER